ncbi:LuxR C-terminal-related transcriptional regulator [Gordonia crocea]|uniref:Putative regulatory protein, LuxR n=1 Tax=Gordonia crocea TaxID=589162 RepID=A0A7M3SV83_9ACTN|nr:LuxR family transcriptional regulator [Gordonia crocea]GED96557.1 putative regulatory protein, LuxR [Gordonia crocea]
MVTRWPLTGRDNDLAALINARRSHAPGVLVTGDAGVGKSRLLAEFIGTEPDRPIIRITGFTAMRDIPFGAVAAWLDATPADPATLIESTVAAIVGNAPANRAPLVIVDDAHWLDEASAMVVNQLASRRHVFVLIALRTLDDAPTPIGDLHRDDVVDHLPLQPLTFDETRDLLEAVLGGRLHRQSAEDLWALTAGNLLYIREIVTADLASGNLTTDGDECLWHGQPGVTETLTELIDKQLGRVADAMADLIDVLAIAGSLPIDALTAISTVSPELVADAVAADLIVVTGDPPTARLVHPLYSEVRLQRMGQLRRARLQGELADAMGAHPSGNPRDIMLRAVLAMESGATEDPVPFLAGAAAAAAWCDIDLTLALDRAAVEAGGGLTAEVAYAYHLTVANQGRAADEALAAILAKPGLPEDQTALLTFVYAGNSFWDLQRPDRSEEILAEALDHIDGEAARATLIGLRGAIACYQGRHSDGLRLTADALAEPTLAGVPHIFTAMGRTISLGATGQYTRIDEYRARAHDDAAISVPGSIRYSLLTLELQAAAIAGDLATADEIAQTYSTEASLLPGFARTLTTYMRGYSAYFRGQVTEAADCIRGVVARLAADERATPGWEYACRNRLATLYALGGQPEKAATHHDWMTDHPHPSLRYVDSEILLSRGWVSAATGETSRALEFAAQAVELTRERGEPGNEVLALQAATQWGDDTTHVRLAELTDIVDGPRAAHAAAHARALADHDADGLWAASTAWAQLGDQLAAADAAAQSAVAFAAAGKRGRAQLARDSARRIARTHGFTTPAIRAMAAPAELTRREWEIVELLAQGLTSREIANRLGVATRTVEGHIYRAMTKTNSRDRTELGAYASGKVRGAGT